MATVADQKQREKVLAVALAGVQYAYHFERAYQLIFRSQIHALRACSNGPVSVSTLKAIYASAVPPLNDPDHPYPFENWLGFLAAWAEFLTVSGETVSLTDMGREFLKYLIDMRYGDKMN